VKITKAIEEVQKAESKLAERLQAVGEKHASEADVYHLSHTLAGECAEQLARLAPAAERYGAPVAGEDVDHPPGPVQTLRRKASQAVRGSKATGLLLISDLRGLYLDAQDTEMAWTVLLQAALARRDRELIGAATHGQEHAQTRAKWVRTRIKEAAPQVYAPSD
jgi:hypothetical protein